MSLYFKDIGIGVGLRSPHYDEFLNGRPQNVSWVEVISENYMNWKGQSIARPLQILENVRSSLPIILHGVSLSIGSCDPIDKDYLTALKELIDRIQPAWISDHLCWTGVNGVNLHDLLPLPYTNEALNLVTDKIHQVQDFLERRILIENPSSYLQFLHSEMNEWEFLAQMAKKADCGILLDINNVYVSSVNHKFNPYNYLASLPKERIGQIHLAGHTNKGNYIIDSHDMPVCDEVWELYRWSINYFGNVSTMLERDDNIPEWAEMAKELDKIALIRREENDKKLSFHTSATNK